MTRIRDIQEQARELRRAQGWDDRSVERRALYLVTELGEAVTEVLSLVGSDSPADTEQAKTRLGAELYDIVWNLCDLANLVEVDLEAAFEEKASRNRERRW